MSKHHTPGPWKWEKVKTSCGCCFRIGPLAHSHGKPNHACIYADYPGQMEMKLAEANARLIAAAPDLLEVLREIMEYNGGATTALHDGYVMERARAAIAKATGGDT